MFHGWRNIIYTVEFFNSIPFFLRLGVLWAEIIDGGLHIQLIIIVWLLFYRREYYFFIYWVNYNNTKQTMPHRELRYQENLFQS